MGQKRKRSGPAFGRTATALFAANCSSRHPYRPDLEALLRILAVRQALDQFSTGFWYATPSALGHLGHVLIRAGQHAGIAEVERRAT